MKKNKQSKEQGIAQTKLQVRVLYRDLKGAVSDVTHNETPYGFGLKGLKWRASCAADDLILMNDKLKLLALVLENRSQVDTDVVRHIIEEVSQRLEVGSDVGSYVQYTQELFEEAEPLPPLGEAEMRKTARSLALVS